MGWEPGDQIVERHIWFGAPVAARPVTVVEDTRKLLATYLAVGSKCFGLVFEDRDRVFEEIEERGFRFGERTWHTHHVLILARPSDAYAAMGFWTEEWSFVGWYVNLQDPIRRWAMGVDTRDLALDILVSEDLSSWAWKDQEELDRAVAMGLLTPEEAEGARRAGEDVVRLVESGGAWWTDWREWAPDPSWPIPTLPEGWDVM